MDMNKVRVVYQPLSDEIRIVRTGKNPNLALDQREALQDVHTAFIQFMMAMSEKGSIQEVRVKDQWYEIKVKPINWPSKEPN